MNKALRDKATAGLEQAFKDFGIPVGVQTELKRNFLEIQTCPHCGKSLNEISEGSAFPVA